MSGYGYTQLVNSPTTARGALIDCIIYCNNLPGNTAVQEYYDVAYSRYQREHPCWLPGVLYTIACGQLPLILSGLNHHITML